MPPDLRVSLGPLELLNPIICGSGEHVATLDALVAAIDAGAAAVVAKSANESEAARRPAAAAAWGAKPANETEAPRRQWDAARWVFLDERGEPVDEPDVRATLLNRS